MRITTGSLKNRRIAVPKGNDIRPTSDRARQAIFNILAHGKPARIFSSPPPQDLNVLDLFCGSGALGFEALSRGAASVCFIDRDLGTARANAQAMGVSPMCDFITADALHLPPARQPFDLIFLDPPYGKNLLPPAVQSLLQNNWLAARALLVCEAAREENLSLPDDFTLLDQRQYGAAQLWVWQRG
jgi:16S rRNA (guanine966-N2)-methyltransferase